MARLFLMLLPLVALMWATTTTAQTQDCFGMGLDYTDGGSYLVAGSSNLSFTFHSTFEGCPDGFVTPILVDPLGNQYSCDDIESQPDDAQQTSTCKLLYSQMQTGNYTIIMQSTDFAYAAQREFMITVGNQGVVVVTVTPTEYVGITVTPEASTSTNAVIETQTVVDFPATVTSYCSVPTQTVLSYLPGTTSTIATVIQHWVTTGVVTNYYQTTLEVDAFCHWPATWHSPTSDPRQSGRTCGLHR
ncbi:hypothetical protein SCUCBS95973_001555 [Sporothrix curviconia]|uniref:Uncharacterized protein n=1 Tax=Sporothrix curviconia TaxID=1260050 RepID=A0ABP0AZP9_9PEZI